MMATSYSGPPCGLIRFGLLARHLALCGPEESKATTQCKAIRRCAKSALEMAPARHDCAHFSLALTDVSPYASRGYLALYREEGSNSTAGCKTAAHVACHGSWYGQYSSRNLYLWDECDGGVELRSPLRSLLMAHSLARCSDGLRSSFAVATMPATILVLIVY
jgi:hypothetical protein